jgi:cellulose synthase/poly-beta-1,6-N-acetylglucosamine synthase-like glycosyltransferase
MRVTVIVPAFNAASTLPEMLASVRAPAGVELEVIVADDGSTDATAAIATRGGARVVRAARRGGPGLARNLGAAQADGEVLVFADADVVFCEDTLARLLAALAAEPQCAAVVGTFAPNGTGGSLASRYKNLYMQHCYAGAGPYLTVVFTSITAVRAAPFREVGGFPDVYPNEDRLFGMLLARRGHRIRFDAGVRVQHLHAYDLRELLTTDLQRARNVARLTLEAKLLRRAPLTEYVPAGIRLAVVCVGGAMAFTLAGGLGLAPAALPAAALCLGGAVWSLRGLFRFMAREAGLQTALACVPVALLDMAAGVAGVAWGIGDFVAGSRLVAEPPCG